MNKAEFAGKAAAMALMAGGAAGFAHGAFRGAEVYNGFAAESVAESRGDMQSADAILRQIEALNGDTAGPEMIAGLIAALLGMGAYAGIEKLAQKRDDRKRKGIS